MKLYLISIVIASLVALSVNGRKFDKEHVSEALKNTRRLEQSYGSTQQIYFNFGNYFWRLDMRPPALQIGWEFMQSLP